MLPSAKELWRKFIYSNYSMTAESSLAGLKKGIASRTTHANNAGTTCIAVVCKALSVSVTFLLSGHGT